MMHPAFQALIFCGVFILFLYAVADMSQYDGDEDDFNFD